MATKSRVVAPKENVLSVRALNRATLARQFLLKRESVAPLAVIERLAGMQNQWPRSPFVGLWSRLKTFRREELLDLLASKKAVRGTMYRGTIHLMSAKDYRQFRPVVQSLLTRGMLAIVNKRFVDVEIESIVKSAHAFLSKAPRTFDATRDHLVTLFPNTNDRAMGYITRMMLPLVMVPTSATWGFPTASEFGLAEKWLGKPVDKESGAGALILRYLAAFGPATVADAQTWSGLQGLKAEFELLRPKLVALRDERGRELFDLPDAPRPAEDVAAPLRFLPDFDNLLLGHQDRTRVIADKDKAQIFRAGLRVEPSVLVDGFAAASWKVGRKKSTATLAIDPFAKLSKSVRTEMEDEAERLVRFMEPDAVAFAVTFAR